MYLTNYDIVQTDNYKKISFQYSIVVSGQNNYKGVTGDNSNTSTSCKIDTIKIM